MSESALLIGSGGRENALAETMSRSPDLGQLYVAPGNPGTESLPNTQNVPFGPGDIGKIIDFAEENGDGLTVVVGPEAPLMAGLANELRERDIAVCGPNRDAAELEGSKAFATLFMTRHGIPQPPTQVACNVQQALEARRGRNPDEFVIKADGLAGGKGVILPETVREYEETVAGMFSGRLAEGAGRQYVLISERFHGPELSVFAVSDGDKVSVLPFFAQDHKRLNEGDQGPNTGGMGAYTPLPLGMLDSHQLERIQEIAERTIDGMKEEGMPYNGVLYMGLMLAEECGGDPVVIEFNARFGDPEAQVVLPSLAVGGVDVYGMLRDTAQGRVPNLGAPQLAGQAALTVCLAAEGYPASPQKGAIIHGLDRGYPDVTIYHGGTKRTGAEIVVSGGRALYVTGRGETVDEAASAAYAAIGDNGVHFDGMHYRSDIGWQARQERP